MWLGALIALALSLCATPVWADAAASLQVLQGCLDATAPAPAPAGASQTVAPAAAAARNHAPNGAHNRLSTRTGAAQRAPRTPRRGPGAMDLRARCPQLSQALSDLGLTKQLSSRNSRLDRGAVADLLRMERRYATSMPSGTPDVALLPIALGRLQAPAPPPRSWWQALKERLRQWFEQPSGSGSDWLQQLLSRISIPLLVQRLILYGTTALVLILAAWLVARELRAAGLTSRRPARRRTGRPAPADPTAAAPLTLADLDQAAPAERSIVLLRLLVQALLQSGRLSAERALTYRELSARGAFDDGAQRERFAQLADRAERDRYGRRRDADAGTAGAQSLHEGRTLYRELREPRARAPAPERRLEQGGVADRGPPS